MRQIGLTAVKRNDRILRVGDHQERQWMQGLAILLEIGRKTGAENSQRRKVVFLIAGETQSHHPASCHANKEDLSGVGNSFGGKFRDELTDKYRVAIGFRARRVGPMA